MPQDAIACVTSIATWQKIPTTITFGDCFGMDYPDDESEVDDNHDSTYAPDDDDNLDGNDTDSTPDDSSAGSSDGDDFPDDGFSVLMATTFRTTILILPTTTTTMLRRLFCHQQGAQEWRATSKTSTIT